MIALRPSAWSLSVKLPLIVCLVVVGVAAIVAAGVIRRDQEELHQALSDKALLLALWVGASVADPMLHNDNWATYRLLRQVAVKGLAGEAEVLTAMALDLDGRVVAHLQPGRNPIGLPLSVRGDAETHLLAQSLGAQAPITLEDAKGRFIEGVVPVDAGGKTIGVVRVRLSTKHLAKATWDAALFVLALTIGLASLASLVGMRLSLRTVRPLERLAAAMGSLGRGELAEVPVVGSDEVAQLGRAFNRMAAEVAEKQRLERELAQSEKAAALGRIAAGVAHEINNPLAGILNCVSTIKDHPDQPGLVERYLPVIERALLRIRAIVQDLLVEQRAEHASELCGGECLDELRELILAEIEGRGIRLDWRCGISSGGLVNRQRLQQAVLNLLKNAVQAMPDGGLLRFSASLEDKHLNIEVEDNGTGIPPDDLRHIFDPFFSTRKGGSGLGLWITSRLLQSMGGEIEVSSEPGQGTLFRMRIPLQEDGNGPTQQ